MNPVPRTALMRVLTIALLLPAASGCWSPSSPDPRIGPPGKQSRSTPRQIPVGTPPSDQSPVTRMTVNGETVEARALWHGIEDELSVKAETMTPEGYYGYVVQRAVQLIRDRIAQLLLSRQALLRLSPEVEERLDGHVDAEIRKTVTEGYDGRQRRYERALEAKGLSIDDARRKIRHGILVASYLDQEIEPKLVEPTRAELFDEFHAWVKASRKPPRRRMSLIDVRVADRLPPGVTRPTREQTTMARAAAMARAHAARAELQDDAYFADIAGKYSDGLHASEGGSWGWVTKGSVRERFEPAIEALFRLEEGGVSEVIETSDGCFLVACDEIERREEPEFELLQPKLKERHRVNQYGRLVAELVAKLRRNARIEPTNLDRFHAAVVAAAPSLEAETRP